METFLKQIVSISLFRDNSPRWDGFWIRTYYCLARSDLQMQSIPDWSSLRLWNGPSPTALEVSYLQCCGNMDEKYHHSGVKINKTRDGWLSAILDLQPRDKAAMFEFCFEEFTRKWSLVARGEKVREVVLFFTTDIAAVTSRANQHFF